MSTETLKAFTMSHTYIAIPVTNHSDLRSDSGTIPYSLNSEDLQDLDARSVGSAKSENALPYDFAVSRVHGESLASLGEQQSKLAESKCISDEPVKLSSSDGGAIIASREAVDEMEDVRR